MPLGPVTAGQMPSSYTPVNSRLPLWANVTESRPQSGGFLRKIGSTPTYTLSPQLMGANQQSGGTTTGGTSSSSYVNPRGAYLKEAATDPFVAMDPIRGLKSLFG